MATKQLCDLCDNEMRLPNRGVCQTDTVLRGSNGRQERVKVELTVRPEHGDPLDICTRCMFRAVRQIDPTPQPEGGEGRA